MKLQSLKKKEEFKQIKDRVKRNLEIQQNSVVTLYLQRIKRSEELENRRKELKVKKLEEMKKKVNSQRAKKNQKN